MEHPVVHEHVSDYCPGPVKDLIHFCGKDEPFEYIGHIGFIGQSRQIISDVNEFENAENKCQNSNHHYEGVTILPQQHSLPVTVLS